MTLRQLADLDKLAKAKEMNRSELVREWIKDEQEIDVIQGPREPVPVPKGE